MYKIDETNNNEKYILLIPSMLDFHFPLMKYAFCSKEYHPIILDNEDGIINVGLKYVNNDMCYPAICNSGQIIDALQSGKYDLSKTRVLMATAGDACRGSNYITTIKRALKKAGFEQVPVVNINVRGIEKSETINVSPAMAWRGLVSIYYGDILMLLLHHLRPNEITHGQTQEKYHYWLSVLSEDLRCGKHLSIRAIKRRFKEISDDFAQISLNEKRKQRIGIVGEIFHKYSHLGNWNLIDYLEEQGCESHTNGVSWYLMYYVDTHLLTEKSVLRPAYKLAQKFFNHLQKAMIDAIRANGFYSMDDFLSLKEQVRPYISMEYNIGDGWLIGAECAGHLLEDCPKVMAVQSFGCMPLQTCGKGIYTRVGRELADKGIIAWAEIDHSGAESNYYNRVQMLIDFSPLKQSNSISSEK
ncbi:2-hydroxyacyl-CoA dehydratase [Pseudobutyrivibrio sp. YE44]|uniref:2-hydroxyacyl-CoA dehydratase n=1 Tax=Pseudobutyrivibrio sp. YE44 TaxID=1520802 RepID=UPI000B81CB0B|nr:2-hydroxyacyl-CoA dehydratase [Pseudobutyrivibrio sp. YE44]